MAGLTFTSALGNVCGGFGSSLPCTLIAPGGTPMGGLLGGGANSTSGSGMEGGQQRGANRLFSRRVFNTRSYYRDTSAGAATQSAMILNGGYRSVMNAGDPLWRYNQACGGSDQVAGRIRNGANASARGPLAGAAMDSDCGRSTSFGSLVFVTGRDENQLASGNQRYVADSSNFTRFKKTASLNGNYNDNSFGGDLPSNQKVALGRVRG